MRHSGRYNNTWGTEDYIPPDPNDKSGAIAGMILFALVMLGVALDAIEGLIHLVGKL